MNTAITFSYNDFRRRIVFAGTTDEPIYGEFDPDPVGLLPGCWGEQERDYIDIVAVERTTDEPDADISVHELASRLEDYRRRGRIAEYPVVLLRPEYWERTR